MTSAARLGHDDHGHTNCWLFGRAAAEIERLPGRERAIVGS